MQCRRFGNLYLGRGAQGTTCAPSRLPWSWTAMSRNQAFRCWGAAAQGWHFPKGMSEPSFRGRSAGSRLTSLTISNDIVKNAGHSYVK